MVEQQMKDRVLYAALGVAFCAFSWTLYSQLHETIVSAGDKAPNFSITTDDGKTITARDFAGGKLLLLNFWATWCDTCVQEIPDLNQMAKDLAPKGLVVLGVSVDQNEQQYKNFLKHFPLDYLTAWDPKETINTEYGTIQYPESYLIDRNGKVVEKFISNQPWASPQMLQHLNSLL